MTTFERSGLTVIGIPRLFAWLGKRKKAEAKPAWGRQSPIDLLADSLVKNPEGWVLEHNAIKRNGVIISWRGTLTAPRTTLTVKMDGRRYGISVAENKNLKEQLIALLNSREAGE